MKSFSHFAAGAALALMTSVASAADIVETAISAGQFKTLVTALQQADLVDTLKGDGPFTVFAPTDAAFAKLPAGAYHVVPGKVMAAQVKPGEVKTVQGQPLSISTNGGSVMVDNAKVTKTDIAASNGVIHVIDTVILPR
jgi:uncharacterized surface protein with fasciclin (FAS1) repeats